MHSTVAETDAGEKAGVVLLDLSAAYDTVWFRGLHLKLLQMIPDRHMVKFIMEMLYNRSFTLNTSDGQCSRQEAQEWRPPGICLGSYAIQRVNTRPPGDTGQEVWVCRRSGYPAPEEVLGGYRRGPDSGYDHPIHIPGELAPETRHCQYHVVCIPPT